MPIEPGAGGHRAPTDQRGRHLLAYERRLVAWQLRRWRAGSRVDVAQTEYDYGTEMVRLWAAYSGGFQLAWVTGVVGIAVGSTAGKFFGLSAFLSGFGVFAGTAIVLFLIAVIRSWQSIGARDEYLRSKSLTQK